MYALDPIDSLLKIYENPIPLPKALPRFEEDLLPLIDHLDQIIGTHVTSVTTREQAATIGLCIGLRNQAAICIESTNAKTKRGY
jgi:hypothetical protein